MESKDEAKALATASPVRKRPIGLKVEAEEYDAPMSYKLGDSTFRKADIAISDVREDELQLVKVIGRGASSHVQKMLHTPTNTFMAVKVINVYEKSKRDQLLQEIRTLHKAACENVVIFYGAFFSGTSVSICLEFCDQGSLDVVLKKNDVIPEKVLACITYQVLSGLNYLQEQKQFHRDIKPPNILLTSSGLTKLTDFGIAKQLQDEAAMAVTFVGTFQYMSPERLRNKPYNSKSDIWSLGLVLVECALGVHPYSDARTNIEMIQAVVENEAPTLPKGKFSEQFEDFVQHCLQKDPNDRSTSDVLIYLPWLDHHGATNLDTCKEEVSRWLQR